MKLLKSNYAVIGVDNINNYYNRKLKIDRVKDKKKFSKKNKKKFFFYKFDLIEEKNYQNYSKDTNLKK